MTELQNSAPATSRRAVLRVAANAAWAAPAVTLMSAVPAVAASANCSSDSITDAFVSAVLVDTDPRARVYDVTISVSNPGAAGVDSFTLTASGGNKSQVIQSATVRSGDYTAAAPSGKSVVLTGTAPSGDSTVVIRVVLSNSSSPTAWLVQC
jgi:hypothetical protein